MGRSEISDAARGDFRRQAGILTTYDVFDGEGHLLRRADLAQRIAKMARQAAVLQPEKLMESRAPALLSKLLDQQPNAVAKNALILASPTFQWR